MQLLLLIVIKVNFTTFASLPFDNENHYILIIPTDFIINKINALETKGNHFSILHLNIAPLNKHNNGLSNLLRLTKLNFPIINLSKYKIGYSN